MLAKQLNNPCSIKSNFESYDEFVKTWPKNAEPPVLFKTQEASLNFRRYSSAELPLLLILGSILIDSIIYHDADILISRIKRAFEYLHEKSEGYNWKIWAVNYFKLLETAQDIKKKAVATGAPRYRKVFYEIYKIIDQNSHFKNAIVQSSRGVLLEELLRNHQCFDNDAEFLLAELANLGTSPSGDYLPAIIKLFTAIFPYQIQYVELQTVNQNVKFNTFVSKNPKLSGGVQLKLIGIRTEKNINTMIGYNELQLDALGSITPVDFGALMQNSDITDYNVLAISESVCEFAGSTEWYILGEAAEISDKAEQPTEFVRVESTKQSHAANMLKETISTKDSSSTESLTTQKKSKLAKNGPMTGKTGPSFEGKQSSESSSQEQNFTEENEPKENSSVESAVYNMREEVGVEEEPAATYPSQQFSLHYNAGPNLPEENRENVMGKTQLTNQKDEKSSEENKIEDEDQDGDKSKDEDELNIAAWANEIGNLVPVSSNIKNLDKNDREEEKESDSRTKIIADSKSKEPEKRPNQNDVLFSSHDTNHFPNNIKSASDCCVRCNKIKPKNEIFINTCGHGHCVACLIYLYSRFPGVCQDDICTGNLMKQHTDEFLRDFESDNSTLTFEISKLLQQRTEQQYCNINQFAENDYQSTAEVKQYPPNEEPAAVFTQTTTVKQAPQKENLEPNQKKLQKENLESNQKKLQKENLEPNQKKLILLECDACNVPIQSKDVLQYPCNHKFCIHCIEDRGSSAPVRCLSPRCSGKIEETVLAGFLSVHGEEKSNPFTKSHSMPSTAPKQLTNDSLNQNKTVKICSLCQKRTSSTQSFKNSLCDDRYCFSCIKIRKLRNENLCPRIGCTKKLDTHNLKRAIPNDEQPLAESPLRCPVCKKNIDTKAAKDPNAPCYKCTYCELIICSRHNDSMNICYCCCPRCKKNMKVNIQNNTKSCQSCQTNICLKCKKSIEPGETCECFCQFCFKPKSKSKNPPNSPLCSDCYSNHTRICSICLDELVGEGLQASCGHLVCRCCKFEFDGSNKDSCKVCSEVLKFVNKNLT